MNRYFDTVILGKSYSRSFTDHAFVKHNVLDAAVQAVVIQTHITNHYNSESLFIALHTEHTPIQRFDRRQLLSQPFSEKLSMVIRSV